MVTTVGVLVQCCPDITHAEYKHTIANRLALLFTCPSCKHSILPDASANDVNNNSFNITMHSNVPEAVTEANFVDDDGPIIVG